MEMEEKKRQITDLVSAIFAVIIFFMALSMVSN